MLRKESQSLFTAQRAHPPHAPVPARRSSHWWRESREDTEKPLAGLVPARPRAQLPVQGGSCSRLLSLLGLRRLRLLLGPRAPRGPRTRLPGAESAGTPQKEPRKSLSSTGPLGADRQRAQRGGRPAPAHPGRPRSDCPTPAAAAAAPARIRARLGHRAIITGARGDVTRTPAPSPPPRGVLENCGARAPRTRAYTHCAPGASRAHSPRRAPRALPLTRTPPSSALDRPRRPAAARLPTGTRLSHPHTHQDPPVPLPHPRERSSCSPAAAAPLSAR